MKRSWSRRDSGESEPSERSSAAEAERSSANDRLARRPESRSSSNVGTPACVASRRRSSLVQLPRIPPRSGPRAAPTNRRASVHHRWLGRISPLFLPPAATPRGSAEREEGEPGHGGGGLAAGATAAAGIVTARGGASADTPVAAVVLAALSSSSSGGASAGFLATRLADALCVARRASPSRRRASRGVQSAASAGAPGRVGASVHFDAASRVGPFRSEAPFLAWLRAGRGGPAGGPACVWTTAATPGRSRLPTPAFLCML